jgi:hypothetical protein
MERITLNGASKYEVCVDTGSIFLKKYCYKNQFGKSNRFSDTIKLNGSKKLGYVYHRIVLDNGQYCYTSAHRIVMWAKLNRMLSKGEIVDHINNKRSDNKISNLRISKICITSVFHLIMKKTLDSSQI